MQKNRISILFLLLAIPCFIQAEEVTPQDAHAVMSGKLNNLLVIERAAENADVQHITNFYAINSSFSVTSLENCKTINIEDQECTVNFTYQLDMNPSSKKYSASELVIFLRESEEILKNPYALHWKSDWDPKTFIDTLKK